MDEYLLRGWITGWRRIAEYIGKSVSTAKRYHYRYGMPVRRLPGDTPVCIPYELDQWLIIADDLKAGRTTIQELIKDLKKQENGPI